MMKRGHLKVTTPKKENCFCIHWNLLFIEKAIRLGNAPIRKHSHKRQ